MSRMTAYNPSYCPSRRIPDSMGFDAALDLAAEAYYEHMLAVPRLWP